MVELIQILIIQFFTQNNLKRSDFQPWVGEMKQVLNEIMLNFTKSFTKNFTVIFFMLSCLMVEHWVTLILEF